MLDINIGVDYSKTVLTEFCCDFYMNIQFIKYFVFIKVVTQIAGFVGIVVTGGVSVNAGNDFDSIVASFLLPAGFVGDDDVMRINTAMGSASVMTAIAAIANIWAGTILALSSLATTIVSAGIYAETATFVVAMVFGVATGKIATLS